MGFLPFIHTSEEGLYVLYPTALTLTVLVRVIAGGGECVNDVVINTFWGGGWGGACVCA